MSCKWHALDLAHRFDAASLRETLDGGQAFRWRWNEEMQCWHGIFGTVACMVRLSKRPGAPLEFSPLCGETKTIAHELRHYLGNAAQFEIFEQMLPLRSDPQLAGAYASYPGLTILRQPFGETLLAFLCSSTKQIVQIRQMCDALAEQFGDSLAPGIHALPTWQQLSHVPETALRRCSLGFRARYVVETACLIAAQPDWLERVPQLPYPEAKAALVELPGVGEKVADCVLLFGAGKLEAFPVDTWILKTMQARYALHGWKPAQIAHFGRVHFGPLAGLAQQFLFADARRQK